MNDVDIVLTFRCELKPMKPVTASQRLAIEQEQTRINYYLDVMADKVRKGLMEGKKIDCDFIDVNS